MDQPEFKSKSTRTIIIVFIVFVMAVICAGYFYYKSQEKRIVFDKENELAAIASLKAGEIAKWRKERVSDCEVIRNNPVLVRHISGYFENENPRTRDELIVWMESLVKNFDYRNILLIDTSMNVRLSYPLRDTMYGDSLETKMPEVFEKGEIIFTGLHASDEIKDAHLDILVPLVDNDVKGIFGIAALRIDPYINLFPLIQHWPTPSKSSETILLRRDGDSVICLNRLRHHENSVLNLKFPLSDQGIPGHVFDTEPAEAFRFIDYRNAEVISIMRKIPDSPWYIIAKVDRQEIYTPLQADIIIIIITAALLILAALAVTGYYWRDQIIRFYRMQFESENARSRAEDAYHQLLVRSEAILASVPNIIMEVDTNKVYRWANKPGYEFFGNDVIGKEASFYFADEQNTYMTVDPLFTGENEKAYVESWQRRKDGEKRLLAWWCRSLSDSDKKVTGVLSSAFDITEQYRAKEELKQSEELLRQNNATKDKFFSIISHDLRSPFASIIGLSELLNEQVANKNYSRIEKYSAIIRNSSYNAMNLLRNLTEWSQVQTGRIEFHPGDFNLNSISDEVTELLNEFAFQKSIKIYNEIPENMIVFADKHMLSTILRNLISNAIKFTLCEGKIRISAFHNESASFVSVTDNGIGIEQDRLEILFNPGLNISTRGTKKEEGTGLGLILCREFVQRHGGEINVESVPGSGSTFTFSLPDKRVHEKANTDQEAHVHS